MTDQQNTSTPPSVHRADLEYWIRRAAHWEAWGYHDDAEMALALALRAEKRLRARTTEGTK